MGCSRRNPAIRVTPQSEIGRLFENRQQVSVPRQLVSTLPAHQPVVTGMSVADCHEVGRILASDSR